MTTAGRHRPWSAAACLLGIAAILSGCYAWPITIAPAPPTESARPAPAATTAPGAPTHTRPPFIPVAPTGRGLYLAALGDFPADLLAELADQVSDKHGIDVAILAPSSLEPSAVDSVRDQFVAEDLLDALVRTYPRPASDDGSVVIGLLADDLYLRGRPDWSWAFGARRGTGYAVLSTARMGSLAEPIPPIIKTRLRKMVFRDVGIMYFGLPLSYDPLSVLFFDVLSVDDLDRMGEEFCGSDCPGIAAVPD